MSAGALEKIEQATEGHLSPSLQMAGTVDSDAGHDDSSEEHDRSAKATYEKEVEEREGIEMAAAAAARARLYLSAVQRRKGMMLLLLSLIHTAS